VSAWLKRFGLHLAAAVGATGIFVAAAAVGASQTRQQVTTSFSPAATLPTRTPVARKPNVVVVVTPTPGSDVRDAPQPGVANPAAPQPAARATPSAGLAPSPGPAPPNVTPERSLAGSIRAVLRDGLDVLGAGGREWHVTPVPGALIRLNGKAARFDSLEAGDTVVILGQAPSGPGNTFVAHAITARRR